MEHTQESTLRPFAVVTGASTGIGYELAKQFAQNGFDLLIASESEAILEAQDTLEEFGTDVECMEVNLATHNGVELLTKAVRSYNRPVTVLAINAGVGVGGEFVTTKLREEINLINLNIISAVHLTKNLLGDMYKNGQGKILFTSSITASMPAPFEAVYGASKAFLNSFADAIRSEAKDHGVTVTILMPGSTNTNFFHRANLDNTQVGPEGKFENDPADVARQGFEAVMAGADRVFAASLKTKLQGWATRILPERIKANFHRKMSEPLSDENSPRH